MIEILKVAIKFAIAVVVMRFYGGLINFILKRFKNKEKKEENNNNV